MRFRIVFTTTCLWYATVEAATFRAPIHTVARTVTSTNIRKLQLSDHDIFKTLNETGDEERKSGRPGRGIRQRPIRVGSFIRGQSDEDSVKEVETYKGNGKKEKPHLEIWDWNELTYITSFSLGTPPQHFNALLSISSSDLFVPTPYCKESCPPGNRYNASASKTSKHHTEYMHEEYLRFFADGQLAEDTLNLRGIEIEGQQFGAANLTIKPTLSFGSGGWDGILGLAPGNRGSFRNISNPFVNMVAQQKLDSNLFSLKLPRGKDDPGEIIFGDVDEEMYEGNLKKLPLVPYDPVRMRTLKDRWVVPASGIGIGGGYASLYGYVATIESDLPAIILPELYVMMLNKYLGVEDLKDQPEVPPSIDCAKREYLEDFTITLAEEKFVLTPYEYTMEIDLGWIGVPRGNGKKRCVSAFASIDHYSDDSYIVLGTPFLKKFYSVFDIGGRTVSFGKLKTSKETPDEKKELKK